MIKTFSIRALPFTLVAVVVMIAPALATNTGGAGALAGIQTQANNIQSAMLGIGTVGAIIGIAFAGLHYVQHRDDWMGATLRVLGGLAAGVVVGSAPALATAAGAGALLR